MDFISSIDPRITLDFLRSAPEDQYFERKGILGDGVKPTKLANEIIGMLNSDGGVIALGVSDDGLIQNLDSLEPEILDGYRMAAFNHIKPPANVKLEEVRLPSGELIFLYHVDQDYERVFSRNDTGNEAVYLRIGASNKGPLDRDQVRKLDYDKSIRKFEDEVREDFEEADFRRSVLEYYMKKLNFQGDYQQLLLNRHLAVRKNGGVFYKNAAILLFAEDPEKYIASASVRYVRYSGTKAQSGAFLNVVKDEIFAGSIPRLIELVRRFLKIAFKDYYYLDISLGKFIKISEYPEDAWLEGVVNALCHRSYHLQGNRVYIKHFDDRIEISNSGPLPAQVTIENIQTTRFSRNPRIARVLTEMEYVRELNEGVSRIYESMKKSMLSEPEYKDESDIVTLTLRNKVSNHEGTISEIVMKKVEASFPRLNPTERQILQFLFENNQANLSGLASTLEKSEQAIRNGLNKLSLLGILEKNTGKLRDRNATYAFKKT